MITVAQKPRNTLRVHLLTWNHSRPSLTPNVNILPFEEATEMEMGLVTKDAFIGKISISMLSLQYPISELPSLSIVHFY